MGTRTRTTAALSILLLTMATALVGLGGPATAAPGRATWDQPGTKSGEDWTQPIPASKMPTRPWLLNKTAYDRYDRWINAYYDPSTRPAAIAYLVYGFGAKLQAGVTPQTLVDLTANPSQSSCGRAAFWAVAHLGTELYYLDKDIYNAKLWGPILDSALTPSATKVAGAKAAIIVKDATGSAVKAFAAKTAVTQFKTPSGVASAVLDAGIATLSAETREKSVNKMLWAMTGAGCTL